MQVWYTLLVPTILTSIIYIVFRHRITLWELFIPTVSTLLVVLGLKTAMLHSNTSDTEWLSWTIVEARYDEEWNEWIHKTCSRRYPCGSDSKGHTRWCTSYYDCSYCENHPAKWYLVDTRGHEWSVSEKEWQEWVKLFGNKSFVDMERHYYTKDGDRWTSKWPKTFKTARAVHTEEQYENRIQASRSKWSFPDVDTLKIRQYGLYQYKSVNQYGQFWPIYSKDWPFWQEDQEKFDRINALYGQLKQIECLLLVYKDKPIEASWWQQCLWQGGNKNELVITVGLNKYGKIDWCKVWSWSDKSECAIHIQSLILSNKGKKIDIEELSTKIAPIIGKEWIRKDFSDFDFLEVQLSQKQEWWCWSVSIIITLATIFWCLFNQYDGENFDRIHTKSKTFSGRLDKIKDDFKQFRKSLFKRKG